MSAQWEELVADGERVSFVFSVVVSIAVMSCVGILDASRMTWEEIPIHTDWYTSTTVALECKGRKCDGREIV